MTEPSAAGFALPDGPAIRDVVSGRTFVVVLAGLVALVGLQWAAVDDRSNSPTGIAFTVASVVAVAATVAASARARRWCGVGAILVAISPSVLTSVSAGERHGAIAALVVCGAAWLPVAFRHDPGMALTTTGVATVIAAVFWWSSGVSRGRAPGPDWSQIVNSTGDDLRAGFGVIGAEGLHLPNSGHLLWWCAVGVVAGATVLGTRAAIATLVPVSIGAFVLVAWVITWSRGPVDASGGMWVVAGVVAFVGASARLPDDAARRFGRALVVTAALVWAIALVHLFRVSGADVALSVGAVVVIAAMAAVLLSETLADRV